MDTSGPNRSEPGRPSGRRSAGRVALIAAVLAVVLGATGVLTALAGRSSSGTGDPAASTAAPTPSRSGHHRASPSPKPAVSVTPSPTADPYALADGTYPTYVRDVDVRGATITVDVLQIFKGEDAVQAAREDGVADPRQYLYAPVYVRNENPLLRTLAVARDVRIHFMGECDSPGSRTAALRELSERTTPFETSYYYSVTLESGAVVRVVQHIAISAC